LVEKVDRLERKVSKTDAHQLWIKNNNMKQLVVKLTDVRILQYAPAPSTTAYTNPVQLDPNYFNMSVSGAFSGSVP
jgi:hypothetical protein